MTFALSFLTITLVSSSIKVNKLFVVSARNLLEVCTDVQLEYKEVIQSDNNVVIQQSVLVMFNYRGECLDTIKPCIILAII